MRISSFGHAAVSLLLCCVAAGCALVNPPPAPDRPGPREASTPRIGAPEPVLELYGIEPDGLLERLRRGFALPDPGGSEVRYYERWFASNPAALDQLVDPGGWYLPYIAGEVFARGMPAEIALLPAVESGFDATARSPSGAAGLWQFTGRTARHYGLEQGTWFDQRMNLEASTRAALDYLDQLHRRLRGDWLLALAAYNAGEGKVRRLMEGNISRGRPPTFRFLNLPRETRHFVPKLIALRNVLADPERHDVALPHLADEVRYVRVDSPRQLHHVQVARICGIEPALVSQINAGQVRRATPPGGPHLIRLPRDCDFSLDAPGLYAKVPERRSADATYTVRSGDSLWRIARAHGLSLAALSHANPGIGADLAPGQRIVIPETRDKESGEHEIVHRVEPGDTLSALANRYRVSARSIARWNRIAINSTLNLGQLLKIYPK